MQSIIDQMGILLSVLYCSSIIFSIVYIICSKIFTKIIDSSVSGQQCANVKDNIVCVYGVNLKVLGCHKYNTSVASMQKLHQLRKFLMRFCSRFHMWFRMQDFAAHLGLRRFRNKQDCDSSFAKTRVGEFNNISCHKPAEYS